jgi:hypothetical protein
MNDAATALLAAVTTGQQVMSGRVLIKPHILALDPWQHADAER